MTDATESDKTDTQETTAYRDVEFPIDEDGEFDHEQMVDEMDIEVNAHPIQGTMHKFNGDLVEVNTLRFGELHVEYVNGDSIAIPVTDLYKEFQNNKLRIERANSNGTGESEVTVQQDTFETLFEYATDTASVASEDLHEALTQAADVLNREYPEP